MDPLHLAIALVPLALYCLLLAAIAFARRPIMISGALDTLLLALGLAGWIMIGPIALFLPDQAEARFGNYVAIPLIILFFLVVSLIILLMKPRLAVYNITSEQLRPLLAESVAEIDTGARWAGDCLTLPKAGVQLCLEAHPDARHVEIVAVGTRQDYEAWRRLSECLAPRLRELPVGANPRGASLLIAAVALLVVTSITWITRPQEVAETFRELFLQ